MAPALSASVDCDVSEMGDLVKTPARKLSTLDVRSEFDGKDVVEFLKGGAGSWDVINWGRCVRVAYKSTVDYDWLKATK